MYSLRGRRKVANTNRYVSVERAKKAKKRQSALAGNRTRVARVASEHSTTEPPVLINCFTFFLG